VFVVLPGDFAKVFGLGAVLLHVFLASVTEDLGSHGTSSNLGQLTHFSDVTLHGIGAIKVLKGKEVMGQ